VGDTKRAAIMFISAEELYGLQQTQALAILTLYLQFSVLRVMCALTTKRISMNNPHSPR